MPRPRGVKPEAVTLTLTDDDWIRVKRTLNAGESQAIRLGSIRNVTPTREGGDRGNQIEFDPRKLAFFTAATYIVGWSLVDLDGRAWFWPANGSVDDRINVLMALDEATFAEIETALEQHRKAERETTEKNATSGGSGTTSSSASAA